jgi:hypothetical protein
LKGLGQKLLPMPLGFFDDFAIYRLHSSLKELFVNDKSSLSNGLWRIPFAMFDGLDTLTTCTSLKFVISTNHHGLSQLEPLTQVAVLVSALTANETVGMLKSAML